MTTETNTGAVQVTFSRWGGCFRIFVKTDPRPDLYEICYGRGAGPDESRTQENRTGVFVVIFPDRLNIFGRVIRDGQPTLWQKAIRSIPIPR